MPVRQRNPVDERRLGSLANAKAILDKADGGTPIAIPIGPELVLGALAYSYRTMARSRWGALDWMVCRATRGAG